MTQVIPPFLETGMLPPGDYEVTFSELRQSVLVSGGDSPPPGWDADYRLWLVDQLEILVGELKQVGITEVYADGSFAEEKNHPNDIDGYFECDKMDYLNGIVERELNLINPNKIWTWDNASRRTYRGYPKGQLPMWHQYRVELWPHYIGRDSGITDEFGNALDFPAAFRKSRDNHQPRGIVKIAA